jgi:hypothetical protein
MPIFSLKTKKMSLFLTFPFSYRIICERDTLVQKLLIFYATECGDTTLSITTFSITTLSITTLSIMTLSITTLSITTLSVTTLSVTTHSVTTLSIMTLGITTISTMQSIVILSVINAGCHIQAFYAECHYPECLYDAECRGAKNVAKMVSICLASERDQDPVKDVTDLNSSWTSLDHRYL